MPLWGMHLPDKPNLGEFRSSLAEPALRKQVVAEFFSTAFFVFLCCGAAGVNPGNTVAISLSFGFVILALLHVTGPISGGHINPAVSLALATFKYVSWTKCAAYVLAQFLGAIVGALVLFVVMPEDQYGCLGANMLNSELMHEGGERFTYNAGRAFLLEAMTTLVFMLVVFSTVSETGNVAHGLGPFPIAMSVMVAHLMSVPLTGCGLNPARSFGPAMWASIFDSKDCSKSIEQVWIFLVAPPIGAVLAGVIHWLISEQKLTMQPEGGAVAFVPRASVAASDPYGKRASNGSAAGVNVTPNPVLEGQEAPLAVP